MYEVLNNIVTPLIHFVFFINSAKNSISGIVTPIFGHFWRLKGFVLSNVRKCRIVLKVDLNRP
jgi:hypothetical protein